MKILILNTAEHTGGAAVAANRLLRALLRSGVSATMLVRDRATDDPAVVSLDRGAVRRWLNFLYFVWERFVIYLCNRLSKRNLFQVSIANAGINIRRTAAFREADVIHIHWINQGFLSLDEIARIIASGKRVVWTLHDLWPATAICHYPGDCVKYRTGCSACPMLNPNPLVDLAAKVARRKGKIDWRRVTFVGCSEWIARTARESVWLREARFVSIPNPIDTTLFWPIDRREARQRLGLPEEKRLILFAAAKLSDTRKGAAFLLEACRLLAAEMEGELEIILMGSDATELSALSPVPVRALGYISGAAKLAEAYSCADLFVIPSLEDNLPNTIMEAMACGTPCVGFRTGGIPEMIDHAVNGYVAASRDSVDLARGIAWVLRHPEPGNLSAACREKVMRCYQESVVAKKYIALYQKLIQEKI